MDYDYCTAPGGVLWMALVLVTDDADVIADDTDGVAILLMLYYC